MYCIQYDEICKKHNFELKHDARGDGVTLEYPADSVPKDTLRLFQNHLPEEVSAMAEKYSSDRFAIFKYNAAACAALAQEAIPYSLDCHRLILVDESHYFETIDIFDDYDIDFDVIGNF